MPAVLFYIGWLSVTFSCGILSGFIEWLIDSGLFQDQFVGGIRIGCRIDPCGILFFSGLIEGSIHSNNNIAGSILQEFFFSFRIDWLRILGGGGGIPWRDSFDIWILRSSWRRSWSGFFCMQPSMQRAIGNWRQIDSKLTHRCQISQSLTTFT